MTYEEVVDVVLQLSPAERVRLMAAISASLEQGVPPRSGAVPAARLIGLARPDDGHIPTDAEIEELLAQALMEKHLV